MYYVYTGRLQPLSLLNEEELKWLCNNIQKEDYIIIGIVNPNPKFPDSSDMAESWTRFKIEFNPLTYWERHTIVSEFVKKNNLENKISAILPLPRPSVDMSRAANFLPAERIMCLSIVHDNDEEENKKIGMEKQGEKIRTIPAYSFDKKLTIISPELIFCLMASGSDFWKNLLSNDVCNYLESINIKNRVVANLYYEQAIKKIEKIYRGTSDYDEKKFIYDIIKGSINNLPMPVHMQNIEPKLKRDIQLLKQLIYNLIICMKNELPSLCSDAPRQYKSFCNDLSELEQLYNLIDNNMINDLNEFKIATNKFNEINMHWKKRNIKF